ncbi:MAG: sulfite exporter TauE/SafE family protein [Rickettsiales bacterium]
MDLLDIALYFAIAAIGGGLNSVAGGGTFLTFPVLILGGLSSIQANIVSTIALWPGAVASAFAYRTERDVDSKTLTPFIIISILGASIGTAVLLLTPEQTFSALVPWLLLVAVLVFTFGGKGIAVLRAFSHETTPTQKYAAWMFQFVIAIYGGYFGAGIGILMLAMLQIMGLTHIHKMNALKTILGSTINAVAVFIFLFSGRVVWDVAGVMIIGAIVGGYVGARMSLRVSANKVRALVSVIGFAMSAYFFLYGV